MKVVGLVSGGKDSILSLMIAKVMGHEPIVLANLYAAADISSEQAVDENVEELDSFMFQTVGHSIIPSIAQCAELPLLRRPIRAGQSRVQLLDYTLRPDPEDEVEVLYELLSDVKEQFPDVRGVVSGAILSHYQRLRVEAVCHRLGLTSIAPMWQLNASQVLSLVAAARVDARLIKVATYGLTPKKHLGRSLLEDALRTELLTLQATVQIHAAGEGGEFESLVVDCPLFPRQRIDIVSTRQFVDKEQPDVAALVITEHALVLKTVAEQERDADVLRRGFTQSACPELAAALSMRWLPKCLTELHSGARSDATAVDGEQTPGPETLFRYDKGSFHESPSSSPSAAIVRTFLGVPASEGLPADKDLVTLEAGALFAGIHEWLVAEAREPLFLLIVCPSMALFLPVNRIYEKYFEIIRPPGRAFVEDAALPTICVEVWSLPKQPGHAGNANMPPALVEASSTQEDVVCMSSDQPRRCLHVQSISAWAAASIGPYAQANRVTYTRTHKSVREPSCPITHEVDHTIVSGRIGMVPLTQALATWADLVASFGGASVTVPPPPINGVDQTVWVSFLSEFMFMMANSVVGLEHFQIAVNDISHATFFVPSALLKSISEEDAARAVAAARCLIECAWDIYFKGLYDSNQAATPTSTMCQPRAIQWVTSSDFIKSVDHGTVADSGTACSSGRTQARLLTTSGLPKGALVEVILERRITTKVVADDDDDN